MRLPHEYDQAALWTGSEMIVWGGFGGGGTGYLNTGAKYNPSTDSWVATSTIGAPDARDNNTAAWTGIEMIVWGGSIVGPPTNTGARYNPGTDSWTITSTANAPTGRLYHTAVWSGSEMIVWGGYGVTGFLNTGGRYNPNTDSWTTTSTIGAPDARDTNTAMWSGSEMIVWGGAVRGHFVNTGGRYNPSTDSWTATSTINAPTARANHTAVWTGSEMIVWGGVSDTSDLNTGGKYNPRTDNWTATSTINVPTARVAHTAVWTGNEMIVWGGFDNESFNYSNTGARYDPSTDSWTATSTSHVPRARSGHTAIWTGSEMIVWGGFDGDTTLNTGGRYCVQSGSPTPTPTPTPGPITLSAQKKKVQGINTVRLTWSGATSANIDVYRNAVVVATTANDGAYDDSTGDIGQAEYTYMVCEAGTQTCSNELLVRFPR